MLLDTGVAVELDPVFGCHVWRGKRDREGYGIDGAERAHTAAWERARGAVPVGKELDHRCRNRACCNPGHLELVDRSENERRKSWRRRVRTATCQGGHRLEETMMVTPYGGVLCRLCDR